MLTNLTSSEQTARNDQPPPDTWDKLPFLRQKTTSISPPNNISPAVYMLIIKVGPFYGLPTGQDRRDNRLRLCFQQSDADPTYWCPLELEADYFCNEEGRTEQHVRSFEMLREKRAWRYIRNCGYNGNVMSVPAIPDSPELLYLADQNDPTRLPAKILQAVTKWSEVL